MDLFKVQGRKKRVDLLRSIRLMESSALKQMWKS
jgi:hypothetical protein